MVKADAALVPSGLPEVAICHGLGSDLSKQFRAPDSAGLGAPFAGAARRMPAALVPLSLSARITAP
ncbi:MAG TPA: hypothetical protein VFY39_10710, partial [Gammaproteobacteria bacterium]|nr:hypothetical protein [Gammaproteobacteria bacterium]